MGFGKDSGIIREFNSEGTLNVQLKMKNKKIQYWVAENY